MKKLNDCSINKTFVIDEIENKYICCFCKKLYINKQVLLKHHKVCKIKKEQTIQIQLQEMNNKIKDLETKIIIPKTTNNTTNNTNNSHNTTNNTNTTNNIINLSILPFNKANNFFNDMEKISLFDRGFKSVEECIKQKHFNKDHPENHNVYISNNRDKYINLFNGDEWIIEDKNEIIDQLITDNTEYLIENFNDMMDELDTKIVNKFNKFKNEIEEGGEPIDEFSNRMKNNIKILLYNNRNMIISTIKLKTAGKIKS
jgi:hypothetical protein